ncbi:MAG: SpoIIE family protein phosphatase [Bacteroidales bacterium]|nr:SpoIIE family protein phosphatase [Bacteroidales bacterium]
MKFSFSYIQKSFSAKLSFYILGVVGFIFILSLLMFYRYTYREIKKDVHQDAEQMLKITNLSIEQVLGEVEKIPENLKTFVIKKDISEAQLFELTRKVICNNKNIYGCAIAFEPYHFSDTQYYFSPYTCRFSDSLLKSIQLGNKDYDYFHMDWYQIPKLLHNSYWSEPYFDEGGGQDMMTTYSVPMYDSLGDFIGIFTADISLGWLNEMVSKMKPYDSSYTFVIGRGGTYIVYPEKERILNESIFSIAKFAQDTMFSRIGQRMVDQESGFEVFENDGEKSHVFFAPIPRIGWSIGMICSNEEIFAELYNTSKILIFVGVAGVLLIFFFSLRIIKNITDPLKYFSLAAKEIAHGKFDEPLPTIKSKDEMLELRNSFEYLQTKIVKYIADLQVATSEKARIESELHIARDIQMGMVPKLFPPYPDRKDVDIFATLTPAREVGGDLFDFFISNEKLYFAIGDVSGKGVPASLLMAVTHSLFRSITLYQSSPEIINFQLNNAISENNDSNMFVTFFAGVLDLQTGILSYSNAGHNPPAFITPDGQVNFMSVQANIPIGVMDEFTFSLQQMTLEKGTTLFFYTDGVTEAENINQELFGDQRLLTALQTKFAQDPKQLISEIEQHIHHHVKDNEQSDDLTMMAIVYRGWQNDTNIS